MSRKQKKRTTGASRDAPVQKRGVTLGVMTGREAFAELLGCGYRPLSECPEVQMCIAAYADRTASMTLRLMQNTERGDVRVRNELSRKMDINPHPDMVRYNWVWNIAAVMLTNGNQITVPVHSGGLLDRMEPLPPGAVSFVQNGASYTVQANGETFAPDEILNFVLNPDPNRPYIGQGFRVALRDIVRSLRTTEKTRAALMESPMPSLIIRADSYDEKIKTEAGRDELLRKYLSEKERGRPWIIPADQISVEQVKPLTLNDLAINTNIELDKRSIAALFGVPAYDVGVGPYNAEENRNFVNTRVMKVAQIICQTLTRGTLYSPDLYWTMNNRSLMNYDMQALVAAGVQLLDRAAMRRNELRDWLQLAPDDEMEEIVLLENYLHEDKLDDQKKLKEGGDGNGNT